MNQIKDVQNVRLVGVSGQKPREPLNVKETSRVIPRGVHQEVMITSPTKLNYPVDDVMGRRTCAYITVEGDVRYRLDGNNPSVATGHLVKSGGEIKLESMEEIISFRITNVSSEVKIQISYKEIID